METIQKAMTHSSDGRVLVTLESYTPDALDLLLSTKETRLGSRDTPPSLWTEEKRSEHLAYMLDTIKSSWEFVDYTFKISGVTRAFTQQLERTRSGSYAEMSLRAVDASGFAVTRPASIHSGDALELWEDAVNTTMKAYGSLVADFDIPIQDARGALPMNVNTGLYAKFNLRALHEMAKVRLCTRTQGEYQDVFRAMRHLVLRAHPWTEPMLQVHCVSTGVCAFPRYGKMGCPVYLPEMDNTSVRERAHKIFWATRHEANPVAGERKAT